MQTNAHNTTSSNNASGTAGTAPRPNIIHRADTIQFHIVGQTAAMSQVLTSIANSAEISVAVHSSAEILLENGLAHRPCCVVTELKLPNMSGLALLQQLSHRNPAVAPVILTRHASVIAAVSALQSGALAFLELPTPRDTLLATIRHAIQTSEARLREFIRRQDIQRRLDSLRSEEKSVLEYVVVGMKNRTIARRLEVSVRTVESRRHKICHKLGVSSLPELVKFVLDAQAVMPYGLDVPRSIGETSPEDDISMPLAQAGVSHR